MSTAKYSSCVAVLNIRMVPERFILLFVLFMWAVLCNAQQPVLAENRAEGFESCGMFSDFVVRSLAVPTFEPTAIRIMPSRYKDLVEAKEGYQRTGKDLIAYDGQRFIPAGFSDDAGMYYYIPWLSRNLGLTLAQSISLFFVSAMLLPIVFGSWGFFLVLRGWRSRAVGFIALFALSFIAYRLGDVYILEYTVPVALIPWFIYYARRQTHTWVTGVVFAISGLIIGVAATVRTQAALPTLAFLAVVLSVQLTVSRSRRMLLSGLLLAGLLLPLVLLANVSRVRDSFLTQHAGLQHDDLSRHTFWQFAYEGLGFISNPYVPGGVCDDVAKARAEAIAPGAYYLSKPYDNALRNEVLSIVKRHPLFVVITLAAKLGIVAMIIAIFANLGLAAAVFRPKAWPIEVAFWAGVGASALPALLIAPSPQYLVGLFSVATLYGVFSIEHALQARFKNGGDRYDQQNDTQVDLAFTGARSYKASRMAGH